MPAVFTRIHRHLLSHSSSVRCGSCQSIVLIGAMPVEVSLTSGFRELCPRCGSAGPFHALTLVELPATVSASETGWSLATAFGITVLLLIALMW